jgi:hypothetical protein
MIKTRSGAAVGQVIGVNRCRDRWSTRDDRRRRDRRRRDRRRRDRRRRN